MDLNDFSLYHWLCIIWLKDITLDVLFIIQYSLKQFHNSFSLVLKFPPTFNIFKFEILDELESKNSMYFIIQTIYFQIWSFELIRITLVTSCHLPAFCLPVPMILIWICCNQQEEIQEEILGFHETDEEAMWRIAFTLSFERK